MQGSERKCPACLAQYPHKGRAYDGRRCYRCRVCQKQWSEGWQGMKQQRFSRQRHGNQFADSKRQDFYSREFANISKQYNKRITKEQP